MTQLAASNMADVDACFDDNATAHASAANGDAEAADASTASVRKPKGGRGMPKGICPQVKKGEPTGMFQARLSWKESSGWRQRFIPGVFKSVEQAMEELAAAQQLFNTGGELAVWSAPPAERNKRGQVHGASLCQFLPASHFVCRACTGAQAADFVDRRAQEVESWRPALCQEQA